jgi:RNA polymerase sigma-70 factor (ECF subfamily)
MDAEEAILLRQRRALVQRALAALPQAERTALVLRDIEGHSTEEVARILGVRPVTIRSQVASARAKVQAFCARLLASPQGGHP